jgi:hypothetical protein
MADLADDENQILLERAFRAFRRLSRSARRMIRLRLWSGSDHPRHLHKTAKPSNRSPPCEGWVGGGGQGLISHTSSIEFCQPPMITG